MVSVINLEEIVPISIDIINHSGDSLIFKEVVLRQKVTYITLSRFHIYNLELAGQRLKEFIK